MSAERVAGREHIPRYTPGFITIRILQLIVALVCLGLSAYTVAYIAFSGNCLMLFTSIVTVGASLYMIVTLTCVPKTYNYWAVLAFDVFGAIFWLVSFAVLAWQAAWYFAAGAWLYGGYGYSYDDDYYDYDSYYDDIYSDSYDYDFDFKRSVGGVEKRDISGFALTYGAILAAAAGLGGVNFLFYLISLIIHSCVTLRHRRAGLHSKPLSTGPGAPPPNTTFAAAGPPPPGQTMYAPAPQQQPMGQVPQGFPPQQGYYGGPGSPVATTGDLSKSSSPQPPPGGYSAPYHPPPHPQQAEAPAGYPPQQTV